MMKIISLALAILLTTGFCKNPGARKQVHLYDRKWVLVKMQQPGGMVEITGRNAFILFNKKQKSAGGNGGCNSFGSSVKMSGNNISIYEIYATEMYCEETHQMEADFFRMLADINRFEVNDKILKLFKEKELLLEFASE